MKIGVFLPTFTDLPGRYSAEQTVQFAERANELGFSSIWAVDHILRITPNPTYAGLSWLDPFQCLTMVAPRTTIPLGCIYCGNLRNPIISTKEMATLMYLSEDRFILSPVLGWYDKEFETAGFTRRTRGARTDEWLEIMELLLTTEGASFEGRFHSFEDITIDPLPGHRPVVWPTGGGAYYEPDALQDQASLKPPVIDRILRYEGWCVSAQSSPTKAAADWDRLATAARERDVDPSELHVTHPNFVHLVETDDRQAAYEVQAPFWNARRTIDGSFIELSESGQYINGAIEDVIRKLAIRAEAFGLDEFLVQAFPGQAHDQLELWAKHLLPAVAEL